MTVYKTTQVFVAGGMPRYTYIPRREHRLEERLNAANEGLCKLVTVTGTTKSGKTVLASRIFPRESCVWVDGGGIGEENDLWNFILEGISGHTLFGEGAVDSRMIGLSGKGSGEVSIPLFGKIGGGIESESGITKQTSINSSLALSPRAAALTQLRRSKRPLVLDDFHYLDRKFQGNIIRALKPLIFEGSPVVLIAIPHRKYDAVKVEKEMTGRLENIQIPTWEIDELLRIPREGFALLNVEVNEGALRTLAAESYGSPHLMQEFCRNLSSTNNIFETAPTKIKIDNVPASLFLSVAEGTGKVIFDKLSKGPRQRSDRMPRTMKNGTSADIYQVVLYALAKLAPGLDTIEYETLRSAIKDVLKDAIPQAHEVTRVLDKMAQIAASDEASTPVLDWEREEQKLHITDPFFAFYLKWGAGMRDGISPV